MRWTRLTGAMVAVLFTMTVGADALPLAGTQQQAIAVTPILQKAAHKPNDWYWSGHWWRPGPWSDHVIQGMVTRRGPGAVFVPWGAERLRHCAAKYRSFDPTTGTYVTRSGKRRICR